MGISHQKESIPITAGNEANKEPHALLEFVSKIDQPIENKKRSEMPFLRWDFVISKKDAIDKGKTILNHEPA